MKRSAFTMVELIFVVVILGILASVAVPRLAASRTDAQIVKAKSDVAAIRSSVILKRSEQLLQGNASYEPTLGNTTDTQIFTILSTPITQGSKPGQWKVSGENQYEFRIDNNNVVAFTYNSTTGSFTCDTTKTYCKDVSQ